jgi:dethiobiotin synthetase
LPVLSQHLLDEFNSRELAEITEANIDIDRILSLAGGTVK